MNQKYHQNTPIVGDPPYIIMIDDDEDDLELFSSELIVKGVKVKTFDSSTQALNYLTNICEIEDFPSLIITDYNMPKKNGYEILQLLKNNLRTRNIPVVILSTSLTEFSKLQLSKAGAFNCFTKPWIYLEVTKQATIFKNLAYSFKPHKTSVFNNSK